MVGNEKKMIRECFKKASIEVNTANKQILEENQK